MSWSEAFFSKALDPQDIAKALASVFKIKEQDVAVQFGDLTTDVEDHVAMICVLNVMRGDFPIYLEIAPWRQELLPQEDKRYTIMGRLCAALGSPALVTSEQGNPYIWVLIRGEGNYQYVSLDADKFDQPSELIELEIDDDLYRFSHPDSYPYLISTFGNIITRKDLTDADFRYLLDYWLKDTSQEDMLSALTALRSEAKRMYREDLLQEAIDRVENSPRRDSE